jgi:type VI secretion system secreted protein Hcp
MPVSFLLDFGQHIPGESQDPNAAYTNKIEIDDFTFGQSAIGTTQTGTGSASGKIRAHDFVFTKHVDRSSPTIIQTCALGNQFANPVTLTCRRTGTAGGGLTPYLVVVFTNVMFSSYQTSGSNNDSGLPAESISLAFAKLEFRYTPQDQGVSQGVMAASYDYSQSLSGA